MLNHSLSVSSWPALGRSKHGSHSCVCISVTFPSPSVLCSVLKERFWAKQALKSNSHIRSENPSSLGGPNGKNDAAMKELSLYKSTSPSLPKANSICQANIIWCRLQPAHLPLPESRPVGSYGSEVLLTDA